MQLEDSFKQIRMDDEKFVVNLFKNDPEWYLHGVIESTTSYGNVKKLEDGSFRADVTFSHSFKECIPKEEDIKRAKVVERILKERGLI